MTVTRLRPEPAALTRQDLTRLLAPLHRVRLPMPRQANALHGMVAGLLLSLPLWAAVAIAAAALG
jgi:hypothetical protein